MKTVLPSIYFKHKVRHPHNVLMAWQESTHVPRAGERLVGSFGDWTVVSVVWSPTITNLFIDILVRDTTDEEKAR